VSGNVAPGVYLHVLCPRTHSLLRSTSQAVSILTTASGDQHMKRMSTRVLQMSSNKLGALGPPSCSVAQLFAWSVKRLHHHPISPRWPPQKTPRPQNRQSQSRPVLHSSSQASTPSAINLPSSRCVVAKVCPIPLRWAWDWGQRSLC
jgi:hypothetical protein